MKRNAAAALAAFALAAAAQAQQASVRLRAQAQPQAAHYTLGDIADIRSADAAFAQALAGFEIGLAPRSGQAQSVPRAAIAAQVERAAPLWRGRLQWQGAAAVALRAPGEPLATAAWQGLAERTLADALLQRGLRAEVRAVEPLADLRLPAAGVRRISARLPERWAPARRMPVWLDITIDGRGWRSLPVWFDVKAQQQVWVARTGLRAGATLQAEDVQAAWLDAATLAALPLPAEAPLDGLRLRRAVDAGAALTAAAVEPRAGRATQPAGRGAGRGWRGAAANGRHRARRRTAGRDGQGAHRQRTVHGGRRGRGRGTRGHEVNHE